MDGIKRSDIMMASPIAKLPGKGGAGTAGQGTAVSGSAAPGAGGLRPIVAAPDPILVPEKAAPAASAPELRTRHLEFRGLVQDMAASPPVDLSRIEALKARISSGSFTIDPSRVADAMLGSLRGKAI